MKIYKKNSKILRLLKRIESIDQDNSLFYAWDKLPHWLQRRFVDWCERYMQVSHKDCFGGWAFGWSKYHEQYILWIKNKREDLS